jgi:hypothetical protein
MFEMKDDPPPFNVLPALAGMMPAVATAAVAAIVTANVRRIFIFCFLWGLTVFPL